MRPRVNLVVSFLFLWCMVELPAARRPDVVPGFSGTGHFIARTPDFHKRLLSRDRTFEGNWILKNSDSKKGKINALQVRETSRMLTGPSCDKGSGNYPWSRGLSRWKRDRMHKMAMPLLMAYKLKFVALIPTLIFGFILLISTTTLAGFFFALFAAVLGLKVH